MAKTTNIEEARAIAKAAMGEPGQARREDAPLVSSAFTFPKTTKSKPSVKSKAPPPEQEYVDRLVALNRVAKVVKGSRRFGFAALVVVGDQKGHVGFGHGKAREVPEAIRKATEAAKRDLIFVPLRDGRTLQHDVPGRYGAGKVKLHPAPAGTGIIAGGPMRAVFETLGVHDVVAKSTGSSNPYDMVRATFDALKGGQEKPPKSQPDLRPAAPSRASRLHRPAID